MERTTSFRRHLATVRQILIDPDLAPDMREMLQQLEADIEESLVELSDESIRLLKKH